MSEPSERISQLGAIEPHGVVERSEGRDMSRGAVPGPFRPAESAAQPGPVPTPSPDVRPAEPPPGSGHPAVDAVIQAIANAAALSPADQVAQYEAAHRTLQETLATIDQA